MSDKAPEKPTGDSAPKQESAWKSWSVLLPALTFLVGLALGAAVVGVASTSDDGVEGPTAQESQEPSPSPSPTSSDLVVTIPAPCVEAAEKAELAFDVLQDAASAVRDLDARRLAEVVDLAQTEQEVVDRLVSECRAQSGNQLLEPAGEPTPQPTTEPAVEPTPSS